MVEYSVGDDKKDVDFFIKHIDNPCGTEVDGKEFNIKEFYIREAKKLLDENNPKRLTDPEQIEKLKEKINEYKGKDKEA